MTSRPSRERLVEILRAWQQIEKRSICQAESVMHGTCNPVIRAVIDIIQRDATMHHQVQQLLIDSLDGKPIALTSDNVEEVWGAIQTHIELGRKSIRLASAARDQVAGLRSIALQVLLSYLTSDVEKHDKLLAYLLMLKRRGMYDAIHQ